jgi:hypothetical protein
MSTAIKTTNFKIQVTIVPGEVWKDRKLVISRRAVDLRGFLNGFVGGIDYIQELVFVVVLELRAYVVEIVLVEEDLLAPDLREENENRVRIFERFDRKTDGQDVYQEENDAANKIT